MSQPYWNPPDPEPPEDNQTENHEPECGVQKWPPPGTKCEDCGGTYSSEDAQVVHRVSCPTGGIKAWAEHVRKEYAEYLASLEERSEK
jgi:hypothetical protein